MSENRKIVRALVFLIIQICYVVFTILAVIYLWDYLPRIVNSILLLILLPVLLAVGLGKLAGVALGRIIGSKTLFMTLVITSVTLWLPVIFPGLYIVKDYFQLVRFKHVENALVAQYKDHRNAGYVHYRDGVLAKELRTKRITKSSSKSGGEHKTVKHYFHVVPVLPIEQARSGEIMVWAVSDERMPYYLTLTADPPVIQGMVVRDPKDRSDYKKTIRLAESEHEIKSAEDPVLLDLKARGFDELISEKKLYTYISLCAVVIVYGLIALIVGWRIHDEE